LGDSHLFGTPILIGYALDFRPDARE
jgi:hypothetical protein